MNLAQLIQRFRVLANDQAQPYFWADEDVVAWLNEAEQQAAIRRRLLRDDSTPEVCLIPLQAGRQTYPLHPKLYEIISMRVASASREPRTMVLRSREWLDRSVPEWRSYPDPTCYAIQDETSLRIVGQVLDGQTLELDVYRLPLQDMALQADPANPDPDLHDTPEIHEANHPHLIQWALFRAFSIPDTEVFDQGRADRAEHEFARYFGPPVDADLRRSTRVDEPRIYSHLL